MTKSEAIKAMREGVKVTHRYFTNDEFIKMESNKIIDENDCILCPDEFWSYRTNAWFDSGWSIFKDK